MVVVMVVMVVVVVLGINTRPIAVFHVLSI